MTTQAEKISQRFVGSDGMAWYADDDDPNLWLPDACLAAGATEELRNNMAKYTFADGSSIVTKGNGWDFGVSGCWCWREESCHCDD